VDSPSIEGLYAHATVITHRMRRADYEQLPHWQLWRGAGIPWASASLHHAHFGLPALVHAHVAIYILPFVPVVKPSHR